jgi:hypothetical protein
MSRDERPAHERGSEGPPAGGPSDRSIAEAAFGAPRRGARREPTAAGDTSGSRQVAGPFRLLLLLTTLFAVWIAFLAVRTNTFSAPGPPQPPASPDAFAPGCPAHVAGQVTDVSSAGLVALGGRLAAIPPRGVRIYERGSVVAGNAWTDDRPTALGTLESDNGLFRAGYEVRWWARLPEGGEADAAADAWQFSSAAEAEAFAARAADPHCRRAAAAGAALVQPGARVLSWINPDNAHEWDVIFARGPFVYRAVYVPPWRFTASTARRALESRRASVRAQTLACSFPDAGCHFARGGSLS